MLGKYHILITLILISPFLKFLNYNLSFLILILGLIAGSLLPDAIDANDSYLLNIKSRKILRKFICFILRFSGKLTRFILKPLSWILKLFFWKLNISHRGLWHSFLGILIISIIWFIITLIFSVYLGNSILFFSFGIFLGCFLHLLQDSFTVTGINWLYPLNFKIRGRTKTVSKFDKSYKNVKFFERDSTIFIYFLLTTALILLKTSTFNERITVSLTFLILSGLIFKIKFTRFLPNKHN